MLSAAERQELAENAMEQLASGLNKAAEAMQSGEEEEVVGEVKPDLANLQDKELFQLLEEAYSYKSKKDRQGKSEIFRVSTKKIQWFMVSFVKKNRGHDPVMDQFLVWEFSWVCLLSADRLEI